MLTFDPGPHKYYFDGKPVPGVTSVLAPLMDFSMIPANALEVSRQKGVAVHKMIELDCCGDLDEDTLPEWMQPVLPKWRAFRDDAGFEVIHSEYRVFHPMYRYAGTLDLFGKMQHAGKFAFIDAKRSFFAGEVTGLQLAAYREAYFEQEHGPNRKGKEKFPYHLARRYGLRINEHNPVRLHEYTDQSQFGEFVALLTAQRVKEKYERT